jgi:hypothetical protein
MADEAPDMMPLEEQLRRLAPRASRIHRDRLMFEAGRAATPIALSPGRLSWVAAVALALLTAAFCIQTARLYRVRPRLVQQIVVYRDQQSERPLPSEAVPEPFRMNSQQVAGAPLLASREPTDATTSRATSNGYMAIRNLVTHAGASAWSDRTLSGGEMVGSYQHWRNALRLGRQGALLTGTQTVPDDLGSIDQL